MTTYVASTTTTTTTNQYTSNQYNQQNYLEANGIIIINYNNNPVIFIVSLT